MATSGTTPQPGSDMSGDQDRPQPETHPTSTWPGITDEAHSNSYAERFKEMAARGEDLHGEARLVDALAPRGARLLDAGCGPGRHGGYLAAVGHQIVGVDIDPVLIESARADHPKATWVVSDLASLDLAHHGQTEKFDGAMIVGNVMDFVTPPFRASVVERIAAHLRPDAFLVVGCRTERDFDPDALDAALPGANLTLEQRFATYDLRPWHPEASFSVSIMRKNSD